VAVPLYQLKAEFFRTLGHPVRIRVLELLGSGPLPVRDLLADIDIEASSLSQQLAVLRRAGIVTSTREGGTVMYALAGPDVADLMRAARSFLTQILAGQADVLDALREDPGASSGSAREHPPGQASGQRAGGPSTNDAAPGPAQTTHHSPVEVDRGDIGGAAHGVGRVPRLGPRGAAHPGG
jgi:ArsR family transcriptional regulator